MEKVYVVMEYNMLEGRYPLGVYPTQEMAMASVENAAAENETRITETTILPWSVVEGTITCYTEDNKPFWKIIPTYFVH